MRVQDFTFNSSILIIAALEGEKFKTNYITKKPRVFCGLVLELLQSTFDILWVHKFEEKYVFAHNNSQMQNYLKNAKNSKRTDCPASATCLSRFCGRKFKWSRRKNQDHRTIIIATNLDCEQLIKT